MPLSKLHQFEVTYLQILDEYGSADAKLEPKLKNEQLVELYQWMVLAREADQRLLNLQRQGRMGTFPLCTGQEAATCAATYAMRDEDWFVGSYRELGGRLMRGQPLTAYYQFWNGLEEGNRMPQGSRTLPISAVVGSQTLHAVGLAYAMKVRGEASAVVTFLGDGATSEGDVHEAMNFAGVWQAPVVFFCINNQWAISLPRKAQTRSETIAQKALAHGFEGIQVDGNDPLAVYRATAAALERARAGGGPTLIEAVTYRLMMHTTADDPRRYRNEEEANEWWKRDPLLRFRRYLEGKGIWNARLQKQLEADVKREIDQTVRQYDQATIKPDVGFDFLWAEPSPEMEDQRACFLRELMLDGWTEGAGDQAATGSSRETTA